MYDGVSEVYDVIKRKIRCVRIEIKVLMILDYVVSTKKREESQ